MKRILLALLVLFCFSASAAPTKKKKNRRQKEAITRIEFESFTRRVRAEVTIMKDSAICAGRSDKKYILLAPGKWNELLATLKNIQLSAVPTWEAPSHNHEFDGAAHCKIVISTKNNSYQTKTFDGGNPMKQLKALYDAIDKIKNDIEANGNNYGN